MMCDNSCNKNVVWKKFHKNIRILAQTIWLAWLYWPLVNCITCSRKKILLRYLEAKVINQRLLAVLLSRFEDLQLQTLTSSETTKSNGKANVGCKAVRQEKKCVGPVRREKVKWNFANHNIRQQME